jgi:hypothetical protein
MNKTSSKQEKKTGNNKEENAVREGQSENIQQEEKRGLNSEAYPQPDTKEHQYKNQPEFIDRNANDKSKS